MSEEDSARQEMHWCHGSARLLVYNESGQHVSAPYSGQGNSQECQPITEPCPRTCCCASYMSHHLYITTEQTDMHMVGQALSQCVML